MMIKERCESVLASLLDSVDALETKENIHKSNALKEERLTIDSRDEFLKSVLGVMGIGESELKQEIKSEICKNFEIFQID